MTCLKASHRRPIFSSAQYEAGNSPGRGNRFLKCMRLNISVCGHVLFRYDYGGGFIMRVDFQNGLILLRHPVSLKNWIGSVNLYSKYPLYLALGKTRADNKRIICTISAFPPLLFTFPINTKLVWLGLHNVSVTRSLD